MKKMTTVAYKGQKRYFLDKSMHNIRSVKVANKKVEFEVYIDLKNIPDSNYEMEVWVKEMLDVDSLIIEHYK